MEFILKQIVEASTIEKLVLWIIIGIVVFILLRIAKLLNAHVKQLKQLFMKVSAMVNANKEILNGEWTESYDRNYEAELKEYKTFKD